MANRLGMSPEDTSKLSISIGGKGQLRTAKGSFSSLSESIGLKAKPTINRSLAHEMKHAADHASGTFENDGRYVAGRLAQLATVPAAVGWGAAEIAGALGNHIGEYTSDPLALVAGAIGALSVWGYSLHPLELRANNFANQNNLQVISLVENN